MAYPEPANVAPWYLRNINQALELNESTGQVFMRTNSAGNSTITVGNVGITSFGNIPITGNTLPVNVVGNVNVTQGTSPWTVTGNVTTVGTSNVAITGTNLDAFGEDAVIAGFNASVEPVIDQALKMAGLPAKKVQISTPNSLEPTSVNHQSPVKPFNGY